MKTVYINESGIRPWNGMEQLSDTRFSTLTLIDHNFEGVWGSWCGVAERLIDKWPVKREWRSIGWGDFFSKTEEYLLNKRLSEEAGDGDLFKKNESTHIYSIIKNLPVDPEKIVNLALEGSSDTILVMQKNGATIEKLWAGMTIFEKKVTAENIKIFLGFHPEIVLCRFFELETHATVQFISSAAFQIELIDVIKRSRIQEITQGNVCDYINRQIKCVRFS